MLELTRQGLYCAAGGFHVDAWEPVDRTVVTHAHGDHAYAGCGHYLTAAPGVGLLRLRVGEASVQGLAYGEALRIGEVTLSLHPAGHILGSSQVRIEHRGEVWVVSGDYKLAADPTCAGFEPVRCHTFLTESTFGLPVYRWAPPEVVLAEISGWWAVNRAAGKTSLLLCYALGKAQRVLAGISEAGPIVVHGAVERVNLAYRAAGIKLAATTMVGEAARKEDWRGALVVAPPSAAGSPWTRRFKNLSTGFASGWMRVRGQRRRRALDRGFALSDHADWPALLTAVAATEAERVLVTHGSAGPLARYLGERGVRAEVLATRFVGEAEEDGMTSEAAGDAGGEGDRASGEDGEADPASGEDGEADPASAEDRRLAEVGEGQERGAGGAS